MWALGFRYRLRAHVDDVIQEIEGDLDDAVLAVVTIAAGDLRRELAGGQHESAEDKTIALATSRQLAIRAAEAAGIATAASCVQTRRLGVDHALRPAMTRAAVWTKRKAACREKRRRLEGGCWRETSVFSLIRQAASPFEPVVVR